MQQRRCGEAAEHANLLRCMCQHGQDGMAQPAWQQQQQQPGAMQATAGAQLLLGAAAAAAAQLYLVGTAAQDAADSARCVILCCWMLHRCFQQLEAALVLVALAAAGRLLACKRVQQAQAQHPAAQRCLHACASDKQQQLLQQAGAS